MINAVEYLNIKLRMCDYYQNCKRCPLDQGEGCNDMQLEPEQMVNMVETWDKEHAKITILDALKAEFSKTAKRKAT